MRFHGMANVVLDFLILEEQRRAPTMFRVSLVLKVSPTSIQRKICTVILRHSDRKDTDAFSNLRIHVNPELSAIVDTATVFSDLVLTSV